MEFEKTSEREEMVAAKIVVLFLKRNCHFLSFPRKRESSLSGYGFRIKCGMTH